MSSTNLGSAIAAPVVAVAPPPQRAAKAQNQSARTVLTLFNRAAGASGGEGVGSRVRQALVDRGFDVQAVGDFSDLAELAAKLSAERSLRAVVVAGGDGSVGAALNATPPNTPLAVVPAGTENLLAKYLGCTADPELVADAVERGVAIHLDAGSANGRLFALMISAGLDADVVRRVHEKRDGNITHLAYARPILEAVHSYGYPPIEASWSDESGLRRSVTGRWVFGVNLPQYAQGLPIVPEAVGVDGLLDLCVFRRGGTAAGLWYLWHVVRRRRGKLSSVSTSKQSRFRLESPVEGVPYQLDGDPGGCLPVEVAVEPSRLTLLVKPETARRLGFKLPGV